MKSLFRRKFRSYVLLFLLAVLCNSTPVSLAQQTEDSGDADVESQETEFYGPHIQMSETEFDFGKLFIDEELTKNFVLQNKGTGILEIYDIFSACGCITALMEQKLVAPGESAEITVTYKAGKKLGPDSKTVTIRTNDPQRPVLNLKIYGNIISAFIPKPAYVFFNESLPHEEIKTELKIERVPDYSAEIIGLETSSDHIQAELEKPAEDGSAWTVHMTIDGGLPIGFFSETLFLNTNMARQPRIEVPVRGRIKGPLSVVPTHCYFRFIDAAEGAEQRIIIENEGNKELEILETSSDREDIKIEKKTLMPGRKIMLLIQLIPPVEPGSIDGNLYIKTNIENQKNITVPISGYLRAAPKFDPKYQEKKDNAKQDSEQETQEMQ